MVLKHLFGKSIAVIELRLSRPVGQPAWFSWSTSNFESHGAYRLRARPQTHLKLARARCSFSMLARGTPWAGRYLQVCFAGLVY